MDNKTISNEYHELKHVSDKLGCRPSDVLLAKEITGSNNRKEIENFLTAAQPSIFPVLSAVIKELYLSSKYNWEGYSISDMTCVLLEEAGEVAKAVNDHKQHGAPIQDIKDELVQTAAMCLKMLKHL